MEILLFRTFFMVKYLLIFSQDFHIHTIKYDFK